MEVSTAVSRQFLNTNESYSTQVNMTVANYVVGCIS